MQLNRREFGAGAAILASMAVLPEEAEACGLLRRILGPRRRSIHIQQKTGRPVNDILRDIQEKLGAHALITTNDECLVPNATKGFVQWGWAHFHRDASSWQLRDVERVNRAYLRAMQSVQEVPDAGLDALLHEGLVEGNEAVRIEELRDVHRALLRVLLAKPNVFFLGRMLPPSEETVEQEMGNIEHFHASPLQWIRPTHGPAWTMRLSILARLGVGYALSTQGKLRLLPAEDPFIDARAEEAEGSGDPDAFAEWVIQKRDEHFVHVVRGYPGRICHMLVGFNHVLTDLLRQGNGRAHDNISTLVIGVRGVEPRVSDNDCKNQNPQFAKGISQLRSLS